MSDRLNARPGCPRRRRSARCRKSARTRSKRREGPSPARQLAANFVQPLALLLWACAGLALVAEMPELSVAIALVVVVNALFSFSETYRAERAVAALRQMLPQRVHVRRDGAAADVASEDVVAGDVLLVAPGDRVAADAEMLTATELRIEESALTGESAPVEPERQKNHRPRKIHALTLTTKTETRVRILASG